jgi:glycosyltransferase involved in cell wall biosynthesis
MKVSIIVTAYNYGRYLERCLRSCLSQNYPQDSYEVIAVDDNSNDNTAEILKKFDHYSNYRFIINEKNVGVAEAANIGIRASLGQYFVRVDADDYVNEDLILFLTRYLMENHDAFCVSCDYVLVDDFENKIERKYAETNPISCGIMYRKDLVARFGLYNSGFRHREEEELRARLAEDYQIHHLRIPLYRYRMHNTNKTKNLNEMDEYKNYIDVLYEKDNPEK